MRLRVRERTDIASYILVGFVIVGILGVLAVYFWLLIADDTVVWA